MELRFRGPPLRHAHHPKPPGNRPSPAPVLQPLPSLFAMFVGVGRDAAEFAFREPIHRAPTTNERTHAHPRACVPTAVVFDSSESTLW